jgi:hypothetical protein
MDAGATVLEPGAVAALRDAEGVGQLAAAMFGAGALDAAIDAAGEGNAGEGDAVAPAAGDGLWVVHVASVHAAAGADERAWRSIAVGPGAPHSVLDGFALAFTRARARVIVVTGAVLRAEPHLRYELFGPGGCAAALQAWRHAARIDPRPELVVLTRGDVDLEHPALHGWARPWLALPPGSPGAGAGATAEVAALEQAAAARGIGTLRLGEAASSAPLTATLAAIRARGWRGVVAIEAGPRVTTPVYLAARTGARCPIDELCLSTFHGPAAPVVAAPWPEPAALAAALVPAGPRATTREASGPWSFRRYVRAPAPRDVAGRATLGGP